MLSTVRPCRACRSDACEIYLAELRLDQGNLGSFTVLLLTNYYLLLTTYYLLLTTYFLLLPTSYFLLATYYYLLLATCYLLLTTTCY